MAIQNINFNPKPEKGVSYTVIADSSTDWPSIGNDVYFYDRATSLPYYKNASGTVVSIFEEGGDSIYTADGTIGTGRVATLTDTLNFSEGTFNLFGLDKDKKVSYISGDSSFGGPSTYVNNALNFRYNTNTGTGQLWAITSTGSSGKISISGSEVLISSIKTNNNLIVSGKSNSAGAQRAIEMPFGTAGTWKGVNLLATQVGGGGADFEMQVSPGGLSGTYETALKIARDKTVYIEGDTLISKKLELSTTTDGMLMPRLTTAQKNAISSPDTNLMVFDTDLSSLQRYNGTAWVNIAAGVGIVQLTQEGGSGDSVFYTDIQSALNAANTSGGDITITLHDNITITTAISTQSKTNIGDITINLNGFTITNTSTDASQIFYIYFYTNFNRLRIINGSIIKTTGTGNAIEFVAGLGYFSMSNCYVYSEGGKALTIAASVSGVDVWNLGNTTFKTNTGYGVSLADVDTSLTNFISISTGSGMACFLNAGGDVTNFKAIAEGTGTALRVRSAITSVTDFYAESNSGNCVLLESLTPIVKDFTAISVSGYAVFASSVAYKIENFYCKTISGTRTIQVPANSILINGDVFSDSTNCAFVSNAERIENVNFTTNSGTYAVQSRFTTSWINCTFRNKDGIAFYNYSSSTSKLKKCTFISEKTSGGTAHAANILDGTSVVTFVNCDFEVADSTVNCIKANASMNMKVANCSFDNSTTPLSSNITLNYLETDAYGNVTT